MSTSQEAAAARLVEERASVTAQLARMEQDLTDLFAASRDTNADDEHDPEGQTIAYERSQLSSLIRRARASLEEIEAATDAAGGRDLRELRGLSSARRRGTPGGQADGADLRPARRRPSLGLRLGVRTGLTSAPPQPDADARPGP